MPTENKAAPFHREDRYNVIKYTDLERLPHAERRAVNGFLRRIHESVLKAGAPARQSVVIESDWPEYEPAWQMIERRMAGQPPVTAAEELDAVLHWRTKHSQAIKERDALQQRLTAADERVDVLEAVSVKQAALLDELGIPLDEVDDLFGETLKNAKRYEYLRSVMAVENFPAPHQAWSEPSEAESKRIDYLCDAALKPEEGRGDVG